MLVERVDDTVFFVRRENSPTEVLTNVRGYGHTFPEAYTTWEPDVRGSSSHHRILNYKFGGLDCLVRINGDGYLAGTNTDATQLSEARGEPARTPAAVDNLVSILSDAKLSSASPGAAAEVTVKEGGHLVDHSSTFELKTRGDWKKGKEDTLAIELPRLWIGQIPNFIMAYHHNSAFTDIKVRNVWDDVKKWERDHAVELSQLAALIHRIIDLVAAHRDQRIKIRYEGTGPLEIREQLPGAGDALSAKVGSLWTTRLFLGPMLSSPSAGYDSDDDDDTDIAEWMAIRDTWKGSAGVEAGAVESAGSDDV